MKKKKPSEKNKTWEKERRDRLNKSFDNLAKLLPNYDPSIVWTKIDIIQKSILYIQILQQRNTKYLSSKDPEGLKQCNELIDALKYFQIRNGQLSDLLKDAKINIPAFNLPKYLRENSKLILNKENLTEQICNLEKSNILVDEKNVKEKELLNESKHDDVILKKINTARKKPKTENALKQIKCKDAKNENGDKTTTKTVTVTSTVKPDVLKVNENAVTSGVLLPITIVPAIQTSLPPAISFPLNNNPLPTLIKIENLPSNKKLKKENTTLTKNENGKIKILPQPNLKLYYRRADGKLPIPVVRRKAIIQKKQRKSRKRKLNEEDERKDEQAVVKITKAEIENPTENSDIINDEKDMKIFTNTFRAVSPTAAFLHSFPVVSSTNTGKPSEKIGNDKKSDFNGNPVADTKDSNADNLENLDNFFATKEYSKYCAEKNSLDNQIVCQDIPPINKDAEKNEPKVKILQNIRIEPKTLTKPIKNNSITKILGSELDTSTLIPTTVKSNNSNIINSSTLPSTTAPLFISNLVNFNPKTTELVPNFQLTTTSVSKPTYKTNVKKLNLSTQGPICTPLPLGTHSSHISQYNPPKPINSDNLSTLEPVITANSNNLTSNTLITTTTTTTTATVSQISCHTMNRANNIYCTTTGNDIAKKTPKVNNHTKNVETSVNYSPLTTSNTMPFDISTPVLYQNVVSNVVDPQIKTVSNGISLPTTTNQITFNSSSTLATRDVSHSNSVPSTKDAKSIKSIDTYFTSVTASTPFVATSNLNMISNSNNSLTQPSKFHTFDAHLATIASVTQSRTADILANQQQNLYTTPPTTTAPQLLLRPYDLPTNINTTKSNSNNFLQTTNTTSQSQTNFLSSLNNTQSGTTTCTTSYPSETKNYYYPMRSETSKTFNFNLTTSSQPLMTYPALKSDIPWMRPPSSTIPVTSNYNTPFTFSLTPSTVVATTVKSSSSCYLNSIQSTVPLNSYNTTTNFTFSLTTPKTAAPLQSDQHTMKTNSNLRNQYSSHSNYNPVGYNNFDPQLNFSNNERSSLNFTFALTKSTNSVTNVTTAQTTTIMSCNEKSGNLFTVDNNLNNQIKNNKIENQPNDNFKVPQNHKNKSIQKLNKIQQQNGQSFYDCELNKGCTKNEQKSHVNWMTSSENTSNKTVAQQHFPQTHENFISSWSPNKMFDPYVQQTATATNFYGDYVADSTNISTTRNAINYNNDTTLPPTYITNNSSNIINNNNNSNSSHNNNFFSVSQLVDQQNSSLINFPSTQSYSNQYQVKRNSPIKQNKNNKIENQSNIFSINYLDDQQHKPTINSNNYSAEALISKKEKHRQFNSSSCTNINNTTELLINQIDQQVVESTLLPPPLPPPPPSIEQNTYHSFYHTYASTTATTTANQNYPILNSSEIDYNNINNTGSIIGQTTNHSFNSSLNERLPTLTKNQDKKFHSSTIPSTVPSILSTNSSHPTTSNQLFTPSSTYESSTNYNHHHNNQYYHHNGTNYPNEWSKKLPTCAIASQYPHDLHSQQIHNSQSSSLTNFNLSSICPEINDKVVNDSTIGQW